MLGAEQLDVTRLYTPRRGCMGVLTSYIPCRIRVGMRLEQPAKKRPEACKYI